MMRQQMPPTLCVFALVMTIGVFAGEHPRFLIDRDELARVRLRCNASGVATDAPDTECARDFIALRTCLAGEVGTTVLPGELAAMAFVDLMAPGDAGASARREWVSRNLADVESPTTDPLEVVIALDWMWDELDPEVRQATIAALRRRAAPLTASDSPLSPDTFREKLAALVLAIVVDERDDRSAAWKTTRQQLIDAGKAYFSGPFANFVRWRGMSPSSPSAAAQEECLTALAIETLSLLNGDDAWLAYRDSVGRWLEHYILLAVDGRTPFVRDDGDAAPRLPTSRWDSMLPLTAHLIASRTRDLSAVAIARRVEKELRSAPYESGAPYWRWVPAAFSITGLQACDENLLPLARNLNGAVIFRSGDALVWIDSGQPCLRRGQHMDAGHFLLRYGANDLLSDSGDHVALEATPAKGGEQRLGSDRQNFDFEQYYVASIAHNCLLFPDSTRAYRWRERPFQPIGGQTPHDSTLDNFAGELDKCGRKTGELLAFGSFEGLAYAAIDLTVAYDTRTVRSYTREFVFLDGAALVVIDRATPAANRVRPVQLFQLPARPRVNGADLDPALRVIGDDNHGGAWRYSTSSVVSWANGSAQAWLTALAPDGLLTTAVGGPAERLSISDGRFQGKTYMGGAENSYERLVAPVEGSRRPANAWYRLGHPDMLGTDFGLHDHWGRIEIEPTKRENSYVFVSVLFFGRVDSAMPTTSIERGEAGWDISLDTAGRRYRVKLNADKCGGAVLSANATQPWRLPTDIARDAPLTAARD